MLPKLHTLAFEYEEHGGAPPADEPDADAGEEPADESSSSFDFDSIREHPDFQEAIQSAARDELGAVLQQAQQDDYGDPLEDVDPMDDPEDFRQNLTSWMRNEIQQAMAPILPTVQDFQHRQNQEQIGEMIERIPESKQAQELLPEDAGVEAAKAIEFMANGFLPDTEARYGPGPRAVEHALRMAAAEFHNSLKAAHAAGYAARNAELGRLSGAPTPTASLKPSEATGIADEPKDEMEAVERWLARNGRL